MFIRLSEKSENMREYIELWSRLIRRQAKSESFYGCPITNFAIHGNLDEEPILKEKITHSIVYWTGIISDFIKKQISEGKLSKSCDPFQLATRIMKLYQGSSAMYRITGNFEYLRGFREDLLKTVESY